MLWVKRARGRRNQQQLDFPIKLRNLKGINFGRKESGNEWQNCLQRLFCLVCHCKVSPHVSFFLLACIENGSFFVVVFAVVMNSRSVNDLIKLIEKLMNGELGRLPRTLQVVRYCDFCVSGRVSCYKPTTDFH